MRVFNPQHRLKFAVSSEKHARSPPAPDFLETATNDATGQPSQPRQAWLIPQPLSSSYPFTPHSSIFGSTADKINKNPLTATFIDDGGFNGAGSCTSNDRDSTGNFSSYHTGGANFGLADGSVTFISDSTDALILQSVSTTAGGEVATLPN